MQECKSKMGKSDKVQPEETDDTERQTKTPVQGLTKTPLDGKIIHTLILLKDNLLKLESTIFGRTYTSLSSLLFHFINCWIPDQMSSSVIPGPTLNGGYKEDYSLINVFLKYLI